MARHLEAVVVLVVSWKGGQIGECHTAAGVAIGHRLNGGEVRMPGPGEVGDGRRALRIAPGCRGGVRGVGLGGGGH